MARFRVLWQERLTHEHLLSSLHTPKRQQTIATPTDQGRFHNERSEGQRVRDFGVQRWLRVQASSLSGVYFRHHQESHEP